MLLRLLKTALTVLAFVHFGTLFAGEKSPDSRFVVGELLFSEDFSGPLQNWQVELESGGHVEASDGRLLLDVPKGATVWFRPRLDGPLLIEYEVMVTPGKEADDRLSDVNCFWMAHEKADPSLFPGGRRRGKFSDYNTLLTYYVGMGGNNNTTTRFRRYIADAEMRPLLPEHDLSGPGDLLVANKPMHLQIIASGDLTEFFRDGARIFAYNDPAPYESGWFAFRTVTSRQEIRSFRVFRVNPASK